MSSELNINPDKLGKDRYRMPSMIIQTRRNNKTYIQNLDKVAQALNRDVEQLLKYMGFALGTSTTSQNKNDPWCVNGVYDATRLTAILYDYIRSYVLCMKCTNPETNIVLSVNNNKKMLKSCIACGTDAPLEISSKFDALLLKSLNNK